MPRKTELEPMSALTENQKTIVKQVNKSYDNFQKAAQSTLDRAIEIGDLLTKLRKTVKRGNWLVLVDSHFPFSKRTAQLYITLYDKKSYVDSLISNAQNSAHLTIGGALELIGSGKLEVEQVHSRFDGFPVDVPSAKGGSNDLVGGLDFKLSDDAAKLIDDLPNEQKQADVVKGALNYSRKKDGNGVIEIKPTAIRKALKHNKVQRGKTSAASESVSTQEPAPEPVDWKLKMKGALKNIEMVMRMLDEFVDQNPQGKTVRAQNAIEIGRDFHEAIRSIKM